MEMSIQFFTVIVIGTCVEVLGIIQIGLYKDKQNMNVQLLNLVKVNFKLKDSNITELN